MIINLLKKTQFISSVSVLYGVTLLLLWQAFMPFITKLMPVTEAYQTNQIAAPPAKDTSKLRPKELIVRSGTPVSLSIPALQLDKEILPGIYDSTKATWNLSDIGVHYALPSTPPNDYGGNTLIYGHNNRLAFGRLYLLKAGDIVHIKTDSNLLFTYRFTNAEDYQPNNTTIFSYQGPPRLTLQTCSGYFNEARRLYTFDLQKVESL